MFIFNPNTPLELGHWLGRLADEMFPRHGAWKEASGKTVAKRWVECFSFHEASMKLNQLCISNISSHKLSKQHSHGVRKTLLVKLRCSIELDHDSIPLSYKREGCPQQKNKRLPKRYTGVALAPESQTKGMHRSSLNVQLASSTTTTMLFSQILLLVWDASCLATECSSA